MENNDEFIKALMSIEPIAAEPIEYRLHYDDQGAIYACSMINHPSDTNYLTVDREQYENYFRYKVENGKLVAVNTNPGLRNRLRDSRQTYKTVENHSSIVLDKD